MIVVFPRIRPRPTEQDLEKAQTVEEVRDVALVLVARLRDAAARLEKSLEDDPGGG